MIEALIHAMGNAFTPELYMFWTRIQCCAWTMAHTVIVFYLIRVANTARGALNLEGHVMAYVVLGATVPIAAFIPFADDGGLILLIELAVTIPHFLLILYLLLKNARLFGLVLHLLYEARLSAARIVKTQ